MFKKTAFFLLVFTFSCFAKSNTTLSMVQKWFSNKTKVGYLEITGEIGGKLFPLELFDEILGSDIRGLIVHINSGGGHPGSGELLRLTLEEIRTHKCPVVALVENMCCSAAYNAAIGADYIVANRGSCIGSIGVIYEIEKRRNIKVSGKETADVEYAYIVSSERKLRNNLYAPRNEAIEAEIKREVDASYNLFCQAVSKARGLSLENRHEWAEARVFNGEQALALNLIDGIGGFFEAKKVLCDLMCKRFGSAKITKNFEITYFTK